MNKIGKVDVMRGVDPLLDNEAVRIIKSLKNFTPGKQGAKPVNVWFHLPIVFSLN